MYTYTFIYIRVYICSICIYVCQLTYTHHILTHAYIYIHMCPKIASYCLLNPKVLLCNTYLCVFVYVCLSSTNMANMDVI